MKIDKKPYRAFVNFTEDITDKFKETSSKTLFSCGTIDDKLDEPIDKVNNYKNDLVE